MNLFKWVAKTWRKVRSALNHMEYMTGRDDAWKLIRQGFTVDDLRSLVEFSVKKDNYRDYDRGMESVADEYEQAMMRMDRYMEKSCP